MANYNESTINVWELTLKDWLSIAHEIGNTKKWALYNWLERYQSLQDLTIDDWLDVAHQVGYQENWAFSRYKEQRDNCLVRKSPEGK